MILRSSKVSLTSSTWSAGSAFADVAESRSADESALRIMAESLQDACISSMRLDKRVMDLRIAQFVRGHVYEAFLSGS